MSNLVAPMVSALTAGVLLILQTLMMLAAARGRQRARQSLGEGDPELTRAVRRHGNLAENAAIFLVAIALYEMMGGQRLWVEAFCGAFVLGRLSHALGLSMKNTVNIFRIFGVVLTVAVGLALGARLVMMALPLVRASLVLP